MTKGANDIIIASDSRGEVDIIAEDGEVYHNFIRRLGNYFAKAVPDGILIFDKQGNPIRKFDTDTGGYLMDANSSDDGNLLGMSFNIGRAQQGNLGGNRLALTDGKKVSYINSNYLVEGMTVCDDGRMLWFDRPDEANMKAIKVAEMRLDGTIRSEIIDGYKFENLHRGSFDCNDQSAMFFYSEEEQTYRIKVNGVFSENNSTEVLGEELPWEEQAFDGFFVYNGRYYEVSDTGKLRGRGTHSASDDIQVQLDIGGDRAFMASRFGKWLLVNHFPREGSDKKYITVFDIDNPSCRSERRTISFNDSPLIESKGKEMGVRLMLASVVPVGAPTVTCKNWR
ncbi:hypothetical protein L1O03_00350 [Corynebacterium uropygiale]|uniref:Uncharacterized protein n=1 Tax=Corynebacterium uropygiale TaxID=1775911 RepID=A0A9X1QQ07_9CORY|nr:hypothetical protein [Corynebacterium uropygiale]MCF4005638.1 hypothetical protein [Corynebacterium uropygiale]